MAHLSVPRAVDEEVFNASLPLLKVDALWLCDYFLTFSDEGSLFLAQTAVQLEYIYMDRKNLTEHGISSNPELL